MTYSVDPPELMTNNVVGSSTRLRVKQMTPNDHWVNPKEWPTKSVNKRITNKVNRVEPSKSCKTKQQTNKVHRKEPSKSCTMNNKVDSKIPKMSLDLKRSIHQTLQRQKKFLQKESRQLKVDETMACAKYIQAAKV